MVDYNTQSGRRLLENPNVSWWPPENEAAPLADYRSGPTGYVQEPIDDGSYSFK